MSMETDSVCKRSGKKSSHTRTSPDIRKPNILLHATEEAPPPTPLEAGVRELATRLAVATCHMAILGTLARDTLRTYRTPRSPWRRIAPDSATRDVLSAHWSSVEGMFLHLLLPGVPPSFECVVSAFESCSIICTLSIIAQHGPL